eukprot:Skav200855  [mRNA]  locus=scaffold2484:111451:121370:+ [translate_table: standard]
MWLAEKKLEETGDAEKDYWSAWIHSLPKYEDYEGLGLPLTAPTTELAKLRGTAAAFCCLGSFASTASPISLYLEDFPNLQRHRGTQSGAFYRCALETCREDLPLLPNVDTMLQQGWDLRCCHSEPKVKVSCWDLRCRAGEAKALAFEVKAGDALCFDARQPLR